MDLDRVHQLTQDRLYGRDLPLAQSDSEISPQRGDSLLVGLVLAFQITGFQLVPAGPKLTQAIRELLDPWPTLGRGHRSVLEGSQVAVNGDLGLLQVHLDVMPLIFTLTADLPSALDGNGKGTLDEVEIREDGSDRLDDSFFELAGWEAIGGATALSVLLAGVADVVLVTGVAAMGSSTDEALPAEGADQEPDEEES